MLKVVEFPKPEKDDLTPDEILEAAKGRYTGVIILGWDEDDECNMASSIGKIDEMLFLLHLGEKWLLDVATEGD